MVTKTERKKFQFDQKATTLFWRVAFSLCLLLCGNITRAENTVKDTLLKAQDLTVKRERQKVSQLFIKAIEKEGRSSSSSLELQNRFKQMMAIFYTEKGQQTFELGETLLAADVSGAIDKYKEAAKIEEGNITIYTALARAYLKSADCKTSLENTLKAREWNPYDEGLTLLQLQNLACLRKTEDFQNILTTEERYLKSLQLFVEVAKAQNGLNNEETLVAETALNRAKELDDKFPETYYWLGEFYRATPDKPTEKLLEPYKKYVELCKPGNSEIIKKYSREPRVCLEYKNVQGILSKSESK